MKFTGRSSPLLTADKLLGAELQITACAAFPHVPQVLGLSELGVDAAALTSHTPKEQSNATLKDMGGTGPRIVYVTPEKVVASKRLMSKLEKLNQARGTDDPSHPTSCLSWRSSTRQEALLTVYIF